MDYETATNFELNKRLLELTCDPSDGIVGIYQHRLAGKMKAFSHALFKVEGCDDELKINYCTDISVTWPLMIKYGVELSPCYNGLWFAGVVESYTNEEEPLYYNGITIREDPLRAIVICLIKTLESKNG